MKVRLTKTQQKAKIVKTEDLFFVMKSILKRQDKIRQRQEYFYLVGMDIDDTINFIELIAIGTLSKVPIVPREIFRLPVLKNVPKVVLVHNHVVADVWPSAADKKITKLLQQAGAILDIQVTDHLIINPKVYMSFRDAGLIK